MAYVVDITPIKGDAGKLEAGPILSDGVILFEDIAQVVRVAVFGVFNTKIINYQDKLDGPLSVAPNARSGGSVILASCVETNCEDFLSKDS